MSEIPEDEFEARLDTLTQEIKDIGEEITRDRETFQQTFDRQTTEFNALMKALEATRIASAVSELNDLRKKGFRPS